MTYEQKDGYWSPREILGYNAKWNIVASDRGRGKTFNTIPWMMNDPGRTQFMSLTRSTEDLRYAVDNDWKGWPERLDLDPALVEWEVDRSYANLYYDNRQWGFFRALSMVDHIKHEEFPKTTSRVMFDEFIPMAWKKLPGVKSEGEALETIIDTIDHDSVHRRVSEGLRPIRVMLYCNPFTWANPILRYFKVQPCGYGIHRIKNGLEGGTVFEHLEPLDTQTGVRRQEGWMKERAFIQPLSKNSVPIWSARLGDHHYIAYRSPAGSLWLIAGEGHAEIKSTAPTRFGSFEGLQIDEFPISKTRHRILEEWTRSGQFHYDSMNTKFGWYADLETYQ